MDGISVRGLTKRYGTLTAVDGLTMDIRQGELFSLLGVNGAGKTTTIRMLSCLSQPTEGDALVMGHSILTERQAVKAVIGVSPQETAVAPNLTARENLELMAGVHGFSREQVKEKTEELIGRFELGEVAGRRAKTLSGGWQRRLSIAMALVSEPQVLFLDEPTLGLDVLARDGLWDVIRSLKGKTTVVLTTHYMEEAEELSDRVGVMKKGRLIALGTPDQLRERTGEKTFEKAFVRLVKEAEA